MPHEPDYRPQGHWRQSDGSGVCWRVWAPRATGVSLMSFSLGSRRESEMTPEGYGYFVAQQATVDEGLRYAYKLPDGQE